MLKRLSKNNVETEKNQNLTKHAKLKKSAEKKKNENVAKHVILKKIAILKKIVSKKNASSEAKNANSKNNVADDKKI